MSNRGNIPMEQPQIRALVNSILDYLILNHGAIIEVIVRDWIKEKDKRLAWKHDINHQFEAVEKFGE